MDAKTPNPSLYNVPFRTDQFNDMPFHALGNSGLQVPNVGLGTWKVGYPETGDGSRVDEQTAFQIFDRAIELGVTMWDTANRYNNASGNAERVIGGWLAKNEDQRRNVVIATKLFGGMDGLTPNHSGSSRGNILESVYASLERMQTDYVDLLYFHRYDPHTPIEESLTAIEDLVRQDLVRYFAVSNFTIEQLDSYAAVNKNLSIRSRVLAVQNQFDLLNGEPNPYEGVLEYASNKGISFIAWSPMVRGLLTEKYLDASKVGPGDRLFDEGTMEKDVTPSLMDKVLQLAALAHGWDMELNQLVIAYMLSLPGMGPIIPSCSNVAQLESNAKGGKIVLTEEQREKVKSVLVDPFPRF